MNELFSLENRVAVVLGGTGVLGGAMARGLGNAGATVIVAGRNKQRGEAAVAGLPKGHAMIADVSDRASVQKLHDDVVDQFGQVDILVNAVGGNIKSATVTDELSFFDLPEDAMSSVTELNLQQGIVMPCQVFGKSMTQNPNGGSIINISSMAAFQPLTRVVGYGASKAAVNNFTQWLAVHFAKDSAGVRVNAIAPGFFLTEQNRFLLTDEVTGELTERGRLIVGQTPMKRFGEPDELIGAAVWLASDASKFVTGTVIPVDGGFSAFSGV